MTPPPTKIRRARLQDMGTVFAFLTDLEKETFDEKVFKKLYLKNLKNKDNVYLIAWDKEPLGYLGCHIQGLLHHGQYVAEIHEMYVAPEARGQGIGKQLLDQLKNILKKRRVPRIEVTSGVHRTKAHRFYLGEKFSLTSKKFVCVDF